MLFGVYAGKILQYEPWYHIPRSANETKLPLFMGSNFKFFWLPSGAKSVFSLIDEIGFEELILNMKFSMLNCQTKRWPMCLSKESCIWRPNMGRLPHPGVKIECSFLIKIKARCCPFNKSFTVECDGTSFELFLPCEIADRAEMTSDTCHCCMWSPLPHQDRGSYQSCEECFANIRFGQCLFISF